MGVYTVLKLTSNPKIENILSFMEQNKNCYNITLRQSKDFNYLYNLKFEYKNKKEIEKQYLNIMINRKDEEEEETYTLLKNKSYTLVTTSYSKISIEIMYHIVKFFGGIFIENDIDNKFKVYEKRKTEKNSETEKNFKKLKNLENELTFSL